MVWAPREVTCEGIRAYRLADVNEIAPTYQSVRKRLFEFRNAAFHVQPKWLSPKLLDILLEPEDAKRIQAVHDAVGAWLRVQFPEDAAASDSASAPTASPMTSAASNTALHPTARASGDQAG